MKTIVSLIVIVIALSGCAVLSALGIGARDLAPSLSHCDRVKYDRTGMDIKIEATCRVPAG
jgi:hypothetical protein